MKAWKPLTLKEYFQNYDKEIYRVVEGQHFIATRKLVDSDEEQNILENEIEQSKPIFPTENSRGQLHYLLYTPFRYPPLKDGGRFHTRREQSIFYGSEELETALSEIAYGRFLFMQHSNAVFKPSQVPYTHFVVKVGSKQAVFLTEQPFEDEKKAISNPTSYVHSQPLGSALRKSGAELFTFFSARKCNGINVGVFSTEVFLQNKPVVGKDKHWSVFITGSTVEFKRLHIRNNKKESHIFNIQDFVMT